MIQKTTIQQIEEVTILQIRALDTRVPLEAAQALHQLKLHLINQYYNEQLLKRAERLMRPNAWQRLVYSFMSLKKKRVTYPGTRLQ
jgi:hypothetical protein